MRQTIEQLSYSVPGMSCDHCRAAVTAEVEQVAGVSSVDVDLAMKRVRVTGTELEDEGVRAAIGAAGYEVG